MLLRKATLDAIVDGDVDVAFRRWKRPTIRSGGTLRTAVGILEIGDVRIVDISSITQRDAIRAGIDLDELLGYLNSRHEGDVYRIEFGEVRDDPRVALRNETDLSEDDVDDVLDQLKSLDGRSTRGAWVKTTLQLIHQHPRVRAQDLADQLGLEKSVFKAEVRKLKELGLTISHSPGYELSPRGEVVLTKLV